MATGTRAMVSNFAIKLICFATSLILVEANSMSAMAADSTQTESWKSLQSAHLAYLKGDGGGEEKATVCNSVKGAMSMETASGCKAHAIGSLATIDSKTVVSDPLIGSPINAISGKGFLGFIEAIMLEPAIPLHTRLRMESKTVALHKHLEGMDPFTEDLTLKRGALIEVLAQAPYQDGEWVKVLVVEGAGRGFIGWANPNDLDIFIC